MQRRFNNFIEQYLNTGAAFLKIPKALKTMSTKETNLLAALLIISEGALQKSVKDIASKAIEEYHKPLPAENVTPENFKELFFAVLDCRQLPSKSELENIINIVHRDFPVENESHVI